jgi:hypothetical protein
MIPPPGIGSALIARLRMTRSDRPTLTTVRGRLETLG